MVQKQVLRTQEKCIYRIQESNLDFYMVIPNCNEISLVLGLMDFVNDEKIVRVSNLENRVVVVPVLDEKILVGIRQNQGEFFQYLDKYFSNVLNLSHKILTHNQLKVMNLIYFYSGMEYVNFRNWFIQKYNGRVQTVELSFEPVSVVSNFTISSNPGVGTNGNVVSSNEVNVPRVESTPVIEPFKEEDIPNQNETDSKVVIPTDTKEPGFVSYVLLGVLVAVLSLVFLYFII